MKLVVLVINVYAVSIAYSIETFNYGIEPETILYADDGRIRGFSGKEGADVVLAAILPIHENHEGVTCTDIVWHETLDYLEAFLYSIDLINNDKSILPNIHLGYDIRDSCLIESPAIEEAVDLVLLGNSDRCRGSDEEFSNDSMSAVPVSAVIGEYSSFVTIPITKFLHIFGIPQISFSATSPLLNNRELFPYFYRTVPSDDQQAQAMIDLALHFNWTYVSTIHSNDLYGEPGMERFKELASLNGICIDLDIGLNDDFTDAQYTDVVNRIYNNSIPNVIVFFSSRKPAQRLFDKIEQVYSGPRKFLWIASDAWVQAKEILKKYNIIGGMWGVIAKTSPDPGFFSYFSTLTPSLNKRNPWFIEYYEDYYKCNKVNCTDSTITSNPGYLNYSYSTFVIDAVFSFAHVVNNFLHDNCEIPIVWNATTRKCEGQKAVLDGPAMRDYLKNVYFVSPTGNHVKFNSNGSTSGIYRIGNYQLSNTSAGMYNYLAVGIWDGTKANSSKLNIYENMNLQFSANQPANKIESHCDQCPLGSITVIVKSSCCGTCSPCVGQNYTPFTHLLECRVCSDKMWGNNPLTGSDSCQDISETYLDPSDPWGIILIIVACLGIIGVIFVSISMGIFWNTPIVKASGREQMILLLVGIALCFLLSFSFVIKPSIAVCFFQRISPWLCLSLILCALFVKLVRITRIFLRQQISGRPKFIGPAYQILFTFLLVGIQMMLVFISLLVVYPEAEEILQLNSKNTNDHPLLIVRCRSPHVALLVLQMLYFSVLLIASNALSMVTIRFPANFREVVYVALSTFCIGIIWIAFVITYTATDNEFRAAILSFAIQMSAMTVLICMFGVRVFIMIFLPGRNVAPTTFSKNTDQTDKDNSVIALKSKKNETALTSPSNAEEFEVRKQPVKKAELSCN